MLEKRLVNYFPDRSLSGKTKEGKKMDVINGIFIFVGAISYFVVAAIVGLFIGGTVYRLVTIWRKK